MQNYLDYRNSMLAKREVREWKVPMGLSKRSDGRVVCPLWHHCNRFLPVLVAECTWTLNLCTARESTQPLKVPLSPSRGYPLPSRRIPLPSRRCHGPLPSRRYPLILWKMPLTYHLVDGPYHLEDVPYHLEGTVWLLALETMTVRFLRGVFGSLSFCVLSLVNLPSMIVFELWLLNLYGNAPLLLSVFCY